MKELLLAAGREIQQRGWIQGRSLSPDGRVCAIGALVRADRPITGDYMLAELFMERVVGQCLWRWNDQSGRTKEEVLAAFATAIESLS